MPTTVVVAVVGALLVVLLAVATRPTGAPPENIGQVRPAPTPAPAASPLAPDRAGVPPPAPGNAPASSVGSRSTPSPTSSAAPAPGSGAASSPELPPDHPPVTAEASAQVSIQWLGHACFYIHSPGGVAVVTDPFDPKATGLAPPATGAHFVTVSQENPRHGQVEEVHTFQGEERTVLRARPAARGDLRVTPIPTGSGNTAYLIEAGGLRVAHLGAPREPLTDAELKAFGAVDVLMAPAGGEGLSPKLAVEAVKRLNPRLVLPMAYAVPEAEGRGLQRVDSFIAASPWAVTRKDSDVMLLSRADLPASTEIWLLRYRR